MSVEHLMAEFTRLIEQRAAGDASARLDERIGYAATALHVGLLRAEKTELEALPERDLGQTARLMQIERELLSPDIKLPNYRLADRRPLVSGDVEQVVGHGAAPGSGATTGSSV